MLAVDSFNRCAEAGIRAHLVIMVILQLIHANGSVAKYRRLLATAGPYLQKAPIQRVKYPIVQRQGAEKRRRCRGMPALWR
jgi:hypothetical protein